MKNVYIKPIASLIQIRMKENIADSIYRKEDGFLFSTPGEDCMDEAKGLNSFYSGHTPGTNWSGYWFELYRTGQFDLDTYALYMACEG